MSGNSALSIKNISKKFGGLLAVEEVSFEIDEHQVMGIIGPNGSGKTTMLNLISGMLKLSSGQIEFFGNEISNKSTNHISRRGIARTFQLVRILPSMTVGENISAGGVFGHRRYWGKDLSKRTAYVLEQVGLSGKGDIPVVTLTYIDQKRVELARALISDPKILLLDEWLAGLNPAEMILGIDLIQQLRFEGRTIVIVEHHMEAIRILADQCVVMNSGIIIAEGTPDEVLSNADVVRAYLGVENA